jgi:hypothetical protein
VVDKSRRRLKNPIYRKSGCVRGTTLIEKPGKTAQKCTSHENDTNGSAARSCFKQSQQNGCVSYETSAPRPPTTRSTTTLKSFPSAQQVVGAGETKTLRYTRVVSLTVDLNLCLFGIVVAFFQTDRARYNCPINN